jgi:hypothetical protein
MRFFDRADTVRRAREGLDEAGYTLEAVTERLGPNALAHLAAGELAPLERATRSGDRLDTVIRLFLVGDTVPLAAARAALAPLPVEAWAAGGTITVDGDEAVARLALRPLGGPERWLVAHDRARPALGPIADDHVVGVGASSMALAGATIRRPVAATFDLGTGCGVQAVYASAHSDRVVAADVNPRAVAMATLTTQLNDLTHVAVRRGDRFDPVAEQCFALVVANPPFVVSPSSRYLFRDSGLPADELCRSIVRTVPNHLVEGGHAQQLASWVHIEGEDWRDRLAGWFDGTGCDAIVLEREALDPSAHAASWLRQTERPGQWQPEYDDWMRYYEANRIEAIGFGLVTLRRRAAGTPWFRAEEAAQDFAMPCGDHLGAAFELADLLELYPAGALGDLVLRVAPDVVLDERAGPAPGGWTVTDRRLRQTQGLRREGQIDAGMAALVAACDGRRPLAHVLIDAAAAVDVDPSTMARAAEPVVRRLIEQGFLLPAID